MAPEVPAGSLTNRMTKGQVQSHLGLFEYRCDLVNRGVSQSTHSGIVWEIVRPYLHRTLHGCWMRTRSPEQHGGQSNCRRPSISPKRVSKNHHEQPQEGESPYEQTPAQDPTELHLHMRGRSGILHGEVPVRRNGRRSPFRLGSRQKGCCAVSGRNPSQELLGKPRHHDQHAQPGIPFRALAWSAEESRGKTVQAILEQRSRVDMGCLPVSAVVSRLPGQESD